MGSNVPPMTPRRRRVNFPSRRRARRSRRCSASSRWVPYQVGFRCGGRPGQRFSKMGRVRLAGGGGIASRPSPGDGRDWWREHSMAEIVLDRVTKIYSGTTPAVDALSLDITDGEFMVFVGPSGCGKSTALRMIGGLEDITSGTVSIGDRVVNDLPPKDRDIAMVFQNYALYPHMTVEDNLAFGLQLRKTPKDEQRKRVAEAAKMLALEPFLKRKPAALSGGQRQRVAIGRALVRNPLAYLMDGRLANLDARWRVSMRAQLSALHERLGVTSIYVTHDQIEAMTLGTRVAVLKDGELMQVNTPQSLFDAPANL